MFKLLCTLENDDSWHNVCTSLASFLPSPIFQAERIHISANYANRKISFIHRGVQCNGREQAFKIGCFLTICDPLQVSTPIKSQRVFKMGINLISKDQWLNEITTSQPPILPHFISYFLSLSYYKYASFVKEKVLIVLSFLLPLILMYIFSLNFSGVGFLPLMSKFIFFVFALGFSLWPLVIPAVFLNLFLQFTF